MPQPIRVRSRQSRDLRVDQAVAREVAAATSTLRADRTRSQ
jgi:hypothetical protein